MTTIQKRNLFLVALTFGAVVGSAIISYCLLALSERSLQTDSKSFVDATVVRIVQDWDEDALTQRSAKEFSASARPEKLTALFTQCKHRLGRLREYQGSKGSLKIWYSIRAERLITGEYVAKCEFDKGEAEVQIRIVRQDAQWRILFFYVSSGVFSN